MPADAQILCTKCGAASAEPRLECAVCGGKNSRVCGTCGNQNSVAKNFCDKCGHSISALGPIAPPASTLPPGAPASAIPLTAVKRLPPSGAPPGSEAPAAPHESSGGRLPLPGQASPGFSRPLDDLWSAPAPLPLPPPPDRGETRVWRAALNTIAALIGVTAAVYGVWNYRETRKPEILVPKLAAQYLEALRTQDYAAAYAFFSDSAKRYATLDDFKASRDDTPWTWSNLVIEYREPGAMLFGYDLHAGGAPPRRDHVLFTQDGQRWVRPYNWTLIREVEEAFDKGNADKGLILASAAATVDPRDPMAWGYLCEAAYYMKLPAEAEVRCLRALDLARTYPSKLTLKSLYHLHAILADTYDHALHSPERALDQYAQMLAFPDISPADQCQILLARATAYAALSRPGETLADLDRGSQLCAGKADRTFIKKMRDSLNAPNAE